MRARASARVLAPDALFPLALLALTLLAPSPGASAGAPAEALDGFALTWDPSTPPPRPPMWPDTIWTPIWGNMYVTQAVPVFEPPAPEPVAPGSAKAAGDGGTASAVGMAGTAGALLLLRLLLPLYHRRTPAQVLEHPLRKQLHAAVAKAPGSSVAELAAAVRVGRTTVAYHLGLMEHAGALWSHREGRVRRCYPGGHPAAPPGARTALTHPKGQALAALVAAVPGVTLTDAARRASLSPSLASWHLARLVAAGVLRRERRGVRVRFYPADWAPRARL